MYFHCTNWFFFNQKTTKMLFTRVIPVLANINIMSNVLYLLTIKNNTMADKVYSAPAQLLCRNIRHLILYLSLKFLEWQRAFDEWHTTDTLSWSVSGCYHGDDNEWLLKSANEVVTVEVKNTVVCNFITSAG